MARFSALPFTHDWNVARQAKAEKAWEDALELHRSGHPRGAEGMVNALLAGASPTFSKAVETFDPPAPGVLKLLLEKVPSLNPMSEDPVCGYSENTLLHVWALTPDRGASRHSEITQILLNGNSTNPLVDWHRSVLALRGNKYQQDAQMLTAGAGNWDLMLAIKPYTKYQSLRRRDKQGQSWMDYWASGVIERHLNGTALRLSARDPAISAFRFELTLQESVLFAQAQHHNGPPLSRLLAAGVDWRLTDFLFPSRLEEIGNGPSKLLMGEEAKIDALNKTLHRNIAFALNVNTPVRGPGISGGYLAGAMVATQPVEALSWVMEGTSHARAEGPRECDMWLQQELPDGTKKAVSPAIVWLASLEKLALALEKKWLPLLSLRKESISDLPALLSQHYKIQSEKPFVNRILAALEQNYPTVFEDPYYRNVIRHEALEESLPKAKHSSLKNRHRF